MMKGITYIIISFIVMSIVYMLAYEEYTKENINLNTMFIMLFITGVCVAGAIFASIRNGMKKEVEEEAKLERDEYDSFAVKQLRDIQNVDYGLKKEILSLKNKNTRLMSDIRMSSLVCTYKMETVSSALLQLYVICAPQNGDIQYKLAADVYSTLCQGFTYHPQSAKITKQYFDITIYAVSKIYWNNGGYIEFENPQFVELGIPSNLISKDGIEYAVTLTTEKVEATKQEINKLNALKRNIDKHKNAALKDIKKLMNEAEIDFPYYASILADYLHTLNEKYIWELQNKDRPAIKAAEKIKEIARELRQARKENKLLELQQSVYEEAFPWLSEYKIIGKDDIKEIAEADKVESEKKILLKYLSPIEYENLSATEKYQLALDRYKQKRKTNWQVGISFERYIGYLYEQKGYKVIYYGAIMGLQDLGRDIIAYNDSEVVVIQCKYWNNMKRIREKHIFQLYGTMLALTLEDHKEYKNKTVRGEFISSATLSDEAKFYAKKMNIDYVENENFDKDYPCIKCNISNTTQDKIYHLPFDQHYDKVQVDVSKGECYVSTVAEAESLGFRRAKKWMGEESE